jgi:glyoxylase-like metal-dependent hydrolase (beta-lactamase superfamily II)
MAKKAAAKRPSGKSAATGATPTGGKHGATIRMYRLGVGDCFLVRFPRAGGDLKILVDCGVHQSQPGGPGLMAKVIDDLHATTNGKLDLIIATHEHYDHLSGFPAMLEKFGKSSAGQIWAPWCQDENDTFGKELRVKKERALTALTDAHARMNLAGDSGRAGQLGSVLGFFGDDAGKKLRSFGAALKALCPDNIDYLEPGEPPLELIEDQLRAFVLGPPRNRQLLRRADPSKKDVTQVYNFDSYMGLLEQIEPALDKEPMRPFDNRYALPLEGSKALSFFQRRYWAPASAPDPAAATIPASDNNTHHIDTGQDWRRIDGDWLGAATTLAMQLDVETNNTSLVIAFELGPKRKGGPVLLFAADAQVGNWLSWQDVKWTFEGREVSGPDLLKRTIVYKVGHHASHNATLNKQGLELMTSLEMALVPTDAVMAKSVKWGTLPWPKLLDRLDEITEDHVIRTDQKGGSKKALPTIKVTEDDLFYEIELQAG